MSPAASFDDGVADLIAMFAAESDDRFAQALADCIMDPVADEVAAFRSPELVARSAVAAKYLIDHVNTVMRTRAGADASNKDLRRRTEVFRNKVGRERAILATIINEAEARKGIIRNAYNPRRRAEKRLYQLALQGDVPAGTAQRLLAEEQERAVEIKREARREAKERARQARAADRNGLSPV